VLGIINDAAVGAELMQRVKRREAWFARAHALVDGWYAAQMNAELRQLPSAWVALAEQKRFWGGKPKALAKD
jgi:hypothetical protein